MFDLAIVNGELVTPRGVVRQSIGVSKGKVAALIAPGEPVAAAETIDARGLLVCPGFIDTHVHTRAPAMPHKEDFAAGTQAAASAGTTTVMEMPVTNPPATNGEMLKQRAAVLAESAYVDFCLYAGGASHSWEDISSLAEAGVIAYKIFLQPPHPGREHEFAGMCSPTLQGAIPSFELIKETGRMCVLHAEDEDAVQAGIARLQAQGRKDAAAHAESRPPYVEAMAVARIVELVDQLRFRAGFVHTSAGRAVQICRDAKQRGLPVVVETCPQYLLFTADELDRVGPYAKINPPLRFQEDIDALWEGIKDGTVDYIGTDHSPLIVSDKESGWEDIWPTPAGAPGVDLLGPAMLHLALEGKAPIERVVETLTEGSARVFDLYPKKGALLPGSDADIVLFDPKGEFEVKIPNLFSKAHDSYRLYDGRRFRGRIKRTISRGRTVFQDGAIVGEAGWGQFTKPL